MENKPIRSLSAQIEQTAELLREEVLRDKQKITSSPSNLSLANRISEIARFLRETQS